MTHPNTFLRPSRRPDPIRSASSGQIGAEFLVSQRRQPVSVAVAEGQAVFRHGLAQLLDNDSRFDVVAVSDGGPEIIEVCANRPVDVLVTDLHLPRTNGIEFIRLVLSKSPETRILVVASAADWGVVPALESGVSGYLLKDTEPEAIMSAVIAVHLGEQVLCREATEWLTAQTPMRRLTRREIDVLYMLAQGAQNKEISEWLQVSEKTVRNYVSRLYRKVSVRDRSQIANYARYAGQATPGSARSAHLRPDQREYEGSDT
jgi:two-component system response regulator DegU